MKQRLPLDVWVFHCRLPTNIGPQCGADDPLGWEYSGLPSILVFQFLFTLVARDH